MKVGVWFYGVGTVLTGILDIAWGAFDASHQPIQSLGKNLPGQHILAYVAGVWLVAAGLAILWRRSARFGAAASAIIYLIFAALWLPRYYIGIHALGWRMNVVIGVTGGLGQQVLLAAPALIAYAYAASPGFLSQKRAVLTTRWMLGLPPIFFGLFHLTSIPLFATFVPHWIRFGQGHFWAMLAGIAFILAGVGICSGIKGVLAARLLALMLFLFEILVEIPPIFSRLHSQGAWAAAAYNLVAIGACLIFASSVANRADQERASLAEDLAESRRDPAVA
ncbi:MAG: hypothetical protein ACRD3F_10195 [Acidobacteriaceae bacterium]